MSTGQTHFAKANLRKILSVPIFVLGWVLAWVVPRRSDQWVFGSATGVGEGTLPVALEVARRRPEARLIWVVGSEEERSAALEHDFLPVNRNSLRGFWSTLRAGHIVFTHGHGDVNRFGIFRGEITHLIHGAPLKKLHLDSGVTTALGGPRFLTGILKRMYQFGSSQITLIVAGSELAAQRLRSAYGVYPGKVQVLGDARDDIIIQQKKSNLSLEEVREKLCRITGVSPSETQRSTKPKFLLYAPTWRDGASDPLAPAAADSDQLLRVLEQENAYLLIRSHPLGAGQYDHLYGERVVAFGSEVVREINPLLAGFDLLITDYSSIVIDFSLLGRPILWFAPDLKEYASSRGLYEPLEVTAAGRVARDWGQAIDRLSVLLNAQSIEHRVAVQDAKNLQLRFHAFPNSPSAERVVREIEKLSLSDEKLIPEGAMFFESFYGNKVTCNPEAIDREISRTHPGIPRYWSITKESTAVPAGAVPVLVGSAEWFAARRRARVLVINDWLRFDFRPRENQIIVQTWHGTMLKHLALERPNVSFRTRLAIQRESRRWSLLLSQNSHSTEHFKKAYAYEGQILEVGYPRVDALVNSLAGDARSPIAVAAAKRRLGVRETSKVLSYVPTWRDNNLSQVNEIDVQQLAHELGPEWVVVARAHSRSSVFGSYHDSSARVVDATAHPDINDVILSADLLVTDYSSVMFDACAANVPLAFFVPDIVQYRDVDRGFTFDFEAAAPGPLCDTREEILRLANELAVDGTAAKWVQQYAESYSLFRSRFLEQETGTAAASVVTELENLGCLPRRSAST